MDEIIALENRRIEAMVSGDVAALGEILADDLIYTHTTARLDTKESFIDAVKTGRSNYKSVDREDVKVSQYGDTAVVTGHAKFHVGDNKFDARFIDVYAKRNNAWQMVAWQSTRVPD
ncbi:MAG: nuclear transport factor 2 family protein [Chloroflexi bacterium]|nr:nuclear transport factor 2 family protein [Chloroflexota bacterium]MDA1271677.1 nuclear transport factor 2 family protein [Chloroflexota bacterium]